MADALTRELARDIGPEQVRAWLYADLPEAHVLTSFEAPTPEVLLERYNLAQAQGVLYRASHVVSRPTVTTLASISSCFATSSSLA